MFGMPGAGKETVTKPLLAAYEKAEIQTAVFEVGAQVRDHLRRNTDFGQFVKGLAPGVLVPDSRIVPVIREGVAQMPEDADWFLDGFPRNLDQVPVYLEEIEKNERTDLMIQLQLSTDPQVEREISEERMRKRGEEAIKAAKNDSKIKPRQDDVDPVARAKRLDEAVVLRDVAAQFADRNKLITVDASGSKEEVWGNIRNLFRTKLQRAFVEA